MTNSSNQPLTLRINLTDEQRRQIFEQSGHNLLSIPVASRAASIRCTFAGIPLRVSRGVFVPSAVSERLFETTLSAAQEFDGPSIIEVGTGSGAIAFALAAALPQSTIYATELSELALRCARANRARLGYRNVQFRQGSLLEPMPKRLHTKIAVIVANVPYVPPSLEGEFASFYPAGTAIGLGEDGLGLVRELAASARQFLRPGGSLVLQLASQQWPSFTGELLALGYSAPVLSKELTKEIEPVAGCARWGLPDV
jgi:release factor glutamine methyltransferase